MVRALRSTSHLSKALLMRCIIIALLDLAWGGHDASGVMCRTPPQRTPFSKIGPNGQVVPEPLGRKQLVIHKFAAPHVRPPSRAAESAAAVACFGVRAAERVAPHTLDHCKADATQPSWLASEMVQIGALLLTKVSLEC